MGLPAEQIDHDDYDDSWPVEDANTWYPKNTWAPESAAYEDPIFLERALKAVPKNITGLKPSQFTERAFYMPKDDGTGYAPFNFEGRRHLRQIYDTPSRRVLLCCGRQVEKTVVLDSLITHADGSLSRAGDVVEGDAVATLDVDGGGWNMTTGRVVWKSHVYRKPCVRITTRQGHTCVVAVTHPMRVWDGWKEAGFVRLGERLGVVRRAGEFFDEQVDARWIRFIAFMLGDGCFSNQVSFTALPGLALDDFLRVINELRLASTTYPKKGTDAVQVRVHPEEWLLDALKEESLWGTKSSNKFIPSWVYRLSKEQTALFINRLWATDGHVKRNTRSRYSLEYCSVSLSLIRGVQSLLWKFGIPSRIRRNWPNYWKKRGVRKYAWILRVETQEGLRRFLSEVACLGKSEEVPLPSACENNNRDTYPYDVNLMLKLLGAMRTRARNARGTDSLRSRGLRECPKYPLTPHTLSMYIDYYRSQEDVDQGVVSWLQQHLNSDVYWDRVVRIEEVGERDCVDFEVEGTHNFVCDGLITHNSTMVGNRAICYMSLVTAMRILLVTPSATQTKTFSNDRIKEPIETSPVLKKFTTKMLSQNILEKQFVNRSKLTMRYAFLNADRCVSGSTRVHFADGGVATVQEVYEHLENYRGRHVWSANPSSKWVEAACLTDAVFQGVRDVFNVRITGGASLRCTSNQPLLTWSGWRQLGDLKPGDFVAVPRRAAHGAGVDSPVEEFRFIGYLLGDGSVATMNACALHNGHQEVLADFRRCARKLGVPLWREQDSNRRHWVHSETKRQGFGGGRTGYKQRLATLGIIGSKHDTKRIPHEMFMGDEEQVAALLGGLFATDGWASVSSNEQYEIGYCSNSSQLLIDMRQLLLRFGIHSYISRQKKPSTKNAQGAYTLSIRHADSVKLFVGCIAVPGKQEELAAVLAAAQKVTRRKNDYDRIPLSYADARVYLLQRYGLSTHSAWKRYRIQLRPGNATDSVGRQVLYSWGVKLGDDWFIRLATSPLGWARIEEVSPAGKEQTYDLTIEGLENYLSDGVYVHNTRGIPAWQLDIDEIQDILRDNIPVIEQCTSHAPDRWKSFVYSGTPKSLDNVIEDYRANHSTQGEWVVPCDGCNTWNVLGEKNIGLKGPICSKCGKGIEPQGPRAQWAWMVEPDPERVKIPWESYRIPQLMVPWKIRNWNELLHDYENYSRAKFFNECLGISYESGMRPITSAQIRECCTGPSLSLAFTFRSHAMGQPFFAGIDWGTGDNAYTVLTICSYYEMKFRIVYVHRFVGEEADPEVQIAKIIEICELFSVRLIGSDWGFGFGMNSRLQRKFSARRVQLFQYMATLKSKMMPDKRLGRWKIHRTHVMSAIFDAIKKRKAEFPPWEEFSKPYAQDFTNIYSEYNEKLRLVMYDHKPGNPDDTFHSFLLAWLVSMLIIPRPDIITPDTEDAEGRSVSDYQGPQDQG